MDINDIKSDFQFIGNRIVEFSITTKNSNPGKLEVTYDIDYNVNNINEKDKMLIGTLDFFIKIKGKSIDGSVPLSINLIMEGGFIANKDKINTELFKDMIEKNGLIVLSQISRSYIIGVTSLSGISPAIKIPMINVFSLIKKKKSEQNQSSISKS